MSNTNLHPEIRIKVKDAPRPVNAINNSQLQFINQLKPIKGYFLSVSVTFSDEPHQKNAAKYLLNAQINRSCRELPATDAH